MGSSSSTLYSYDEHLLKDNNEFVFEVPESKEKGFSSVYRHPRFKEGYSVPTIDGVKQDNVWTLFCNSVAKNGDHPCMGFRGYNDKVRTDFASINYNEVFKICEGIAGGLDSIGVKKQETVGLYSKNRAEWMQVHLANQRQGYQTVALYDTLGDEAVSYIIQHAELKVVFCEKVALKNVLKAKQNAKCLEYVVVFDYQEVYGNTIEKLSEQEYADAKSAGVTLLGLSELIAKQTDGCKPTKVAGSDTCFLMYTSGTTGTPKGVQLSHEGFCLISYGVSEEIAFKDDDRHLSFLPLAHIFECLVETVIYNSGGLVNYYQGNIRKLTEDWVAVRPTILIGVPRVFARVYDKTMAKTTELNCIKKLFFNKALAASSAASRTGDRVEKWDSKIWNNVAAQVGFDQVRVCLSGAAPLPPYLAEFLRIVLVKGVIVQGYGMTETTGGSVVQSLSDVQLGNVGIPVPGVDIRLEDIPDMNYMTTDENPRGEILIRGKSVMKGYLKNEKATAETIVDGWLHTGDVGRINPNGTLSIIDRKKNLFKTSFGEYIAVEKVEAAYGKASAVAQLWVYGNSFKSFIVGIVVPDALWAKDYLKKQGLWSTTDDPAPGTPEFSAKFEKVVGENMEVLKNAVLASMRQQEQELKRFERVKDIQLECKLDNLLQGFCVENDMLTPSFKLRRPNLVKKYVDDLKKIYEANGEAPKPDEHWVKK